jgi:hypothetical protein
VTAKADRLADSNAGADLLGRIMEARYGPDWRPEGNGLVPTHAAAPTEQPPDGPYRLTQCGERVHFVDVTDAPTCRRCRARDARPEDRS